MSMLLFLAQVVFILMLCITKLNYGINKESIVNQEQKFFSFNPNL